MATLETLEGRTLLSNVVTSFTHDAITGAVRSMACGRGVLATVLDPPGVGALKYGAGFRGLGGKGGHGGSPSQRWASRLRRTWSARRMARRASSPLTRGGLAPRRGRSPRARGPAARPALAPGPGRPGGSCRRGAPYRGRLAQVDAVEVEPAVAEDCSEGRTSVALLAAKSSEA